jgi:RNA polymerase sigma-70 factor, ECF subfamily
VESSAKAQDLCDPLLVAGLRAGDAASQRQFWRSSWPDVFRVVCRVLGPGVQASEIAVDVLTDFLIHYVHQLEDPRAVRAYLRLMALRRALKARAQGQRSVTCDMDDLGAVESRGVDESAAHQIMLGRLERCLGGLTGKAQQALALRFRGGVTDEKIGDVLGVSKQYVGRFVDKSIVALRKCLATEEMRRRGARQPAERVSP